MTNAPAWRRYLRFWRSNIAEDVDDELRFHVEMRVQEYVARGMTEDEARRAVARRLGDVNSAKAECVELGKVRETHARNADFLDGVRTDVWYALRSLGRAPGWTTIALLTIALGVGATTTVFSVADTLLVRPFPYPDASRVYMARRQFGVNGGTVPVGLPFGMANEWRAHARTIESATLVGSGGSSRLSAGADTITVQVARVDPYFFAFAGARPLIGRAPRANEIHDDGPGAILLTEDFWRRAYGASTHVVGRTMRLGDRPVSIVGIVPASLSIPDFRAERADVLELVSSSAMINGPVLVRLAPGVSAARATAELEAILQHANLRDVRPVPMPMPLRLTQPQDWLAIRQPIVMLTGAVALLLLVACTNIAHLLLARGATRQRELAVRHALGAGRPRLLRQLVTESLLLAVLGGALAAFVGWAGLRLLRALRPAGRDFVALSYVSADHRLLSIAAMIAIVCGLAIGLLTALRIAHRNLGASLRAGLSGTLAAGRRLRSSLVVAEVALSATLLVAALLLIHAVFDLQRADLGFDTRGLYSVSLSPPKGMPPAERRALAEELRDRLAAAPGVDRAIVTSRVPGGPGFTALTAYETPDHPAAPDAASSGAEYYDVPPQYFAMMHMALLAGRTFDEGSRAANEVVVSRSLARQITADGNVIGRRFRNAVSRSRGPDEPWQTVIGIVPDVVTTLTGRDVVAQIYRLLDPSGLAPGGDVTLAVRLSGPDPIARLRQLVAAEQPGSAPVQIVNVRDRIEESLAEPLFVMRILGAFAALGVALAAIGLFGVISYSVGQRTREIGVRMTLGATRASIARLVIGDGIRLALAGVVVGLLGAGAATRLIENLLYSVSRFDPFSFGLGAVVLLAVAFVACVVPTLRATGVDPAIAVRAE